MSTHSSWTTVRSLYTAALALDAGQRQQFLDQNCEDPELRQQVEKLLVSESTVTDFEPLDNAPPKPVQNLAPGTILGHYTIQKRLGAGGMGQVYEATDQKLQRAVAIKIIQAGTATAADRARFLREAQSVSALNHPNIVTVYEASQHDGLDFIAMERVHGQTLRHRIGSKGLDVRSVLRYAVQIADAVAAAHEAGIIHRDLKPSNIMVTDRDVIKVLDFGLAKRDSLAPGSDTSLTGKGHIVGTAAYMSPEQAQGHPVDARSDVFSFGSVLYEMMTGAKAFHEDSHVGIMAAILHKDPQPVKDLSPGTPAGLTRVINKCLQKKPHERWQDMQDLKLVLTGLMEDLDLSPSEALRPLPSSTRKPWLIPAVIAGGLALGALAMYSWTRVQAPETPNEPVYRMITADSGLNDYPALSRDGKFIAFASDRAGNDNLDIWLQQIGGREMIQLTKDPVDETDPTFSPDGTHIAYRSEKDGGGIYVIQALGGDPTLLVREGRNPRYSPDGKHIAYWTERSGGSFLPGATKIFVIDAAGGEPRRINHGLSAALFPVWSPKGDALVAYGCEKPDSSLDYWILPVNGETPRSIKLVSKIVKTNVSSTIIGQRDSGALDWAPSGSLITPFAIGNSINLWESMLDAQDKIVGLPHRITRGPGRQMRGSRSTMDGIERLGFSDVTLNYDIWSASPDPAIPATRLTDSVATEWAPSVTANGRHLLFIAQRSGTWAVVLREIGSGRERILMSSPFRPSGAAISGDGSRIAYSDEKYNLRLISAQGGAVENVPVHRGTMRSLSLDGRYAAFEPVKDEDVVVFDTVQKQLITLARRPDEKMLLSGTNLSPDEKWVTFHGVDITTRNSRIWISAVDLSRPVPAGQWIEITDDRSFAQDPSWSPNGDTIYFSTEKDGFRCFWGQHLDPKTKKPLRDPFAARHFHSARQTLRGTMTTANLTGLSGSSGKLIYSIGESKGNIWLEERKHGR